MKNPYIAIVGTHSSGKSVLCKALQPHIDNLFGKSILITGVSRFVHSEYKLPINEKATVDTQYAIEKVYDLVEKLYMGFPRLADRTIIDRYAYTLANNLPLKDYYETLLPIKLSLYNKIFYLPIEFNLVKDGVRSEDTAYRKKIDEIIQEILNKHGIEYYELNGSVKQRVVDALAIIGYKKEEVAL